MGFGSCLVNPLGCARDAFTGGGGSNNGGNSNSNGGGEDEGGRYVCNNGWVNFIPSTSGATLILDQVCDTNNSSYTNGDFRDTVGGIGGGIMQLIFGENWMTYVRIILGLILLGVVSKIRNLFT